MTSYPFSTSNAAAADESTPPAIATPTLFPVDVLVDVLVLVLGPPRILPNTSPTTSATRSISSSVFPRPIPNRTPHPASAGDIPSASKTSDGASEPDVHAAPVETQIPSASSAAATNCPGA